MRNVGHWWPRVSAAGVLAVLALAMVVGLRPAPGEAVALRSAQSSAPAAAAIESPQPGALLAPIAARGTIASSGEVAYALVGGALTLADIPTAALAAYQRAAAVINLADTRCHLDWELVAALGKVLTDHGREGGSELDDEGVSRPAVLGQRLSGRHGTTRVSDTDAGLFDRDTRFDRAVGPLLLLPAVWSVVNVDADADGRRNPQDVDDAALSAAVLLCAGPGDFRNASHVRSEIRRYHSGAGYTKSVLGVRAAYRDAQPVSTAVSVLAREEGVSPEVATDAAETPADPSFSGGSSFEPGGSSGPTSTSPSPSAAAPTPGTAPSGTPSESPSASPSASDPSGPSDPSDSPSTSATPSPSASPTDCSGPTPTDEPSPTSNPTSSPDPCPTSSPTGSPSPGGGVEGSDPEPSAGAAVALAVPVPVGAVLMWWRRRTRRSDLRDATST
jgi:hypothetical protein